MQGTTKGYNKWKISFFILLSINILVLIIVARFMYPLFQTPETELPAESYPFTSDDIVLRMNANKEELATFINNFLQENETDFTILLEDDVALKGNIQILNMNLPLFAEFEPSVTTSGNLVLSLKTITLGNLKIPHRYILQHFSNIVDLPEWVLIVPEEELIYINFYDVNEKATKFRLETFDLQEDEIVFSIVHYKNMNVTSE